MEGGGVGVEKLIVRGVTSCGSQRENGRGRVMMMHMRMRMRRIVSSVSVSERRRGERPLVILTTRSSSLMDCWESHHRVFTGGLASPVLARIPPYRWGPLIDHGVSIVVANIIGATHLDTL